MTDVLSKILCIRYTCTKKVYCRQYNINLVLIVTYQLSVQIFDFSGVHFDALSNLINFDSKIDPSLDD